MKKHVFSFSTAFCLLCCLLPLVLSAQPCTPVNKISSFLYSGFIIGEQNTMELRAEYGSIYLRGVFTVMSGALPPGVILEGNKIIGIPTAVGTYIFTIGASSAAGCPVFQRTFTLNVSWNLPCREFAITPASPPPSAAGFSGSITFRTEHFDSVQYSSVSLPAGFNLNHNPGSYETVVTGTPQNAGLYTIVLAAQSNKGCRDTIHYTWQVYLYCPTTALDSINPRKPKLPYGVIGISYDQAFDNGYFRDYNIVLSEGSLPPGLTLENKHIIGTPTTVGIYHFTLRAIHPVVTCAYIEQPYYIEVSPPNTVCKIYDAIAPTPAEVSANTYYVKKNFNITLSAGMGGITDDSARFKLTEGNLPDGITLNGNILSGQIDHARTWNFTIGAFSKDGCPYYEQSYVIQFILKDPCDAFNLQGLMGEPGFTMVGVNMFVLIGTYSNFDSVTYEAVHLPVGFEARDYGGSIEVSGRALYEGYEEFVIAGTTVEGCQDTLTIGQNFTCLMSQPFIPDANMLPYVPIHEPYSQYVGFEDLYMIVDVDYTLFRVEVTQGSLPPGLTLRDTDYVGGFIEGTPTTEGSYTFTVSAIISECTINEQTYTLVVRGNTPFQSFTLHPVCSEDVTSKTWRVHNPNGFGIPIRYGPVYYDGYTVSILPFGIAPAGEFYITIYADKTMSPTLPGTIRLSWADPDGTPRSITKSASTELCDPPACAYASDVVTVHQGLTKNGYNIDIDASKTTRSLGNPDAHDEYSARINYYSLGYNGFIVLRMSSDIYNEPGNDFTVHEYSYGEPTFAKNPERAEVQISQNGTTWVTLGLTTPASCQGTLDHAFDIAGKLPWFRYVKVIDKTDRNARILNGACSPTAVFAFDGLSDGFDLDAITCANGNAVAREVAAIEEEPSHSSASVLYPNPVKDWLTIDLSKENIVSDKQVELRVIDLSGNSLYRNIHSLESDGTTQIKVSDLRTGMYILRVRTTTGSSGFYKFIKD
jgi:hypothetical protein